VVAFVLAFFFLLATPAAALRHPANVPVARAKIKPDGTVDFRVRLDMLAYILQTPPENTLDPPMLALLDGSQDDLQKDLDASEDRFKQGLKIVGDNGPGVLDSIQFPTAKDIDQYEKDNPDTRLPVMMTIIMTCHFQPGVKTSSFKFPEALGSVVLTTEFPYTEPISESVDPGSASEPQKIPTQQEIDAAKAAIEANDQARNNPAPATPTNEALVQKQIQARYDAWSKAYMANDVETLLSILAPDYVLKMSNGNTLSHDEYKVVLEQRKAKGQDTTKYATQIIRVNLHGTTAAIWSRETMTQKGKDPNTGKPEDIQYQHDYIDIWTFANGRWLLEGTTTQKEQSKIGRG